MGRQNLRMKKNQGQNEIVNLFSKKIKEMHIKGMVQGSEINSQIILDMINDGKTLEDIKSFCESNLKTKETTEKIAMKEKENK